MKLNSIQVMSLALLLKYRDKPPSYGERLRRSVRVILLLAITASLVGYVTVRLDIPGGVLLAIGLFVGAILWELLQLKRFIQWWPVSSEITDWSKVERLLADARGASGSRAAASTSPSNRRLIVLTYALTFTILVGLAFGGQRALAFVHDPRRGNPPDSVVVLTASWCGYCMRLRETLAANQIPYTDIDIDRSAEGRWAFTAVRGTGVPIAIVGQRVVRGTRWDELDRVLKAAGYRDFKKPSPVPASNDADNATESSVSRD